MDAFRYLAAAIAAALNGSYEDAGRIFAYAIKASDAKSLMKELAQFAVDQHVASTALTGVQYDEAQRLLQSIVESVPTEGPKDTPYIPTAYDPSKETSLCKVSESAGPWVGQETPQDSPTDRLDNLYNTNAPVPKDQTFQSLDQDKKRLDRGEEQRRSRKESDSEDSDAESSTEFADFPESSDDAKKQTGDSPLSIVDTAVQNEEDEKEQAMSSTPKHHSHRRQGSRLARAVSVALASELPQKVSVLSTSEVCLADDAEPNTMNHDANTDRSDWVDENDLIHTPNPTKLHNHEAGSSDDTIETDSDDDAKEDSSQIDETVANRMQVVDVTSTSATILDFAPPEDTDAGLIPVDDDVEDDPSEDDIPIPDDDIEGAPAIPASFSHAE